jgi:hypothetical protein
MPRNDVPRRRFFDSLRNEIGLVERKREIYCDLGIDFHCLSIQ